MFGAAGVGLAAGRGAHSVALVAAASFASAAPTIAPLGDDDRLEVHRMTVNGSIARTLRRRAFVIFETEAAVDRRHDNEVGSPVGGPMNTRAPLSRRTRTGLLVVIAVATLILALPRRSDAAWGKRKSSPAGADVSAAELDTLQARLRRFADLFAVDFTDSTRRFAEAANSSDARIQALVWRIETTDRVWQTANQERPFEGLVDTLTAIAYRHRVAEERWLQAWGEPARPIVDSLARNEVALWALTAQFLSPSDLAELRAMIADWITESRAERLVDYATFPSVSDLIAARSRGADSAWLLRLIGLDPLAGMSPAVAQVKQSRLLAERALYELQHLPELTSARVELIGLRTANSQRVEEALGDWERVSASAQSVASRFDRWPADLAAEREAALNQASRELTAQREGLLRDLAAEREAALNQASRELTAQREGLLRDIEKAREPLTSLLQETRATAEASREMSTAMEGAIHATQALTESLAERRDQRPGSRPFDIVEYGDTAARFEQTARAITELIRALETNPPQVRQLVGEIGDRVDRSADHLYSLALRLLGWTVAAITAAVLFGSWLRARWLAPRRRDSPA